MNQFIQRGKSDLAQIDTLKRVWSEEKRNSEVELERLKGRLKSAEEQITRDVTTIATLEEKLKESSVSASANLDDVDGEDLNDEMNTSRKNL